MRRQLQNFITMLLLLGFAGSVWAEDRVLPGDTSGIRAGEPITGPLILQKDIGMVCGYDDVGNIQSEIYALSSRAIPYIVTSSRSLSQVLETCVLQVCQGNAVLKSNASPHPTGWQEAVDSQGNTCMAKL